MNHTLMNLEKRLGKGVDSVMMDGVIFVVYRGGTAYEFSVGFCGENLAELRLVKNMGEEMIIDELGRAIYRSKEGRGSATSKSSNPSRIIFGRMTFV